MAKTSPSEPKKVSASNTKNEILKAYNNLLENIKEEKSSDPIKESEAKKKAEALNEISGQSDEKIIQQIASLKLSTNASLDSVEDQLNSSYKQLQKTTEAKHIQEERLKELYQINAEADSLAALLASQKEKKLEFERYIAEEKEKWEKEQKEYYARKKEEEENLKKQRKREEEEYGYALRQKRKIENDQYEEKKARQERELKEKKETFEQEIRSREQAVAESEEELNTLRKQVVEFPEILNKEIDKAVKETTAALKKDFDHQNLITLKESENQLNLKDHTIENLMSRIKDMETQVKQAYSKVETAEKNLKDITLKAIESNSSSRYQENRREQAETPKSQPQ